jgi:hypothetical protein
MTAMLAIAAYTGAAAQALSAADASSNSRKHDCNVNKGIVNLTLALRSTNRGLTESAIMQVAELKILYPMTSIMEAKNVIDSLAIHANLPSVRYKAYLASNVCDNPEWFANKGNIKSDNEFFESVDAQLHERILGSRTN